MSPFIFCEVRGGGVIPHGPGPKLVWQTGLQQIASCSLDRFLYLPFRDRVVLWISRLRTVMYDAGMFAGGVNLCGTIRVDVRDLG